jgi:hypothetical protein
MAGNLSEEDRKCRGNETVSGETVGKGNYVFDYPAREVGPVHRFAAG